MRMKVSRRFVKALHLMFHRMQEGDTLFFQSVGRTDLPTGSMSTLVRSVKEKLLSLPEDVKVYPGHGEATSIGYEKAYNPFL